MKLTKILAGLAVAGVLTACGQTSSVASGMTDAVKSVGSSVSDAASTATNAVSDVASKTTTTVSDATSAVMPSKPTFETGAYYCDVQGKKNQVVSVTYAFVDGKPSTATVSIHRKVVGAEMKFDSAYKDGSRFIEGNKTWDLDYGFAMGSVAKTVPVMFTDNNKILAKNCQIITK